MISDAALMLSGSYSAAGALTGQTVTATAVSTNTIDAGPLGLGGNQITGLGDGEPLDVVFTTLVAAAAAGAATVTFQLIQADDAALTANVQVLASSDAIPIASLTAGAQTVLKVGGSLPFPPKRYIGARYVVATGPLTAGAFTALMTKNAQTTRTVFKGAYGIA